MESCGGEQSVSFRVNGLGRVWETDAERRSSLENASAGVMLTLESDLQRLVEKNATMTRGAAIVADTSTGEILAMVSRPDYEPTDLAAALSAEGSPLLNRAITDYNLGAVFKIVTAAAALEMGIPTTRTYECVGAVTRRHFNSQAQSLARTWESDC